MFKRRDLIIGLPLLAAASGAYALTPRKRLNLLGNQSLEAEIPMQIGSWGMTPSNTVILPKSEAGSLADRLYDQTVSRLYVADNKLPVMLVVAYGSTQSDQLQLHRPEVCYRAVGFDISHSRPLDIPLSHKVSLPARFLVASTNERTDPILYWTRIGDYLPTTGAEQRIVKLRESMHGYLADGVLVRLSTLGKPTKEVVETLEEFARELLASVPERVLPALIGRPLARDLV